MWKPSFCIGVDAIDYQYEALFILIKDMMTEFCDNITMTEQQYISIFSTLKEQILRHFADEEAYLKSISFTGLEAHKEQHAEFIDMILDNEIRIKDKKYTVKNAKFFAGSLVTWFLFHVANTNPQYTLETEKVTQQADPMDLTYLTICNVFEKLAGLNIKKIENHSETFSEVSNIFMGIVGDMSGYISIAYPGFLVDDLVFVMLNYKPLISDEFVMSSILEVTKIIGNLVAQQISKDKDVSLRMGTPVCVRRYETPTPGSERLALDTGMGIIEVEVHVSPIPSEEAFQTFLDEKTREIQLIS